MSMTLTSEQAEKMIEVFTDWLNELNARNARQGETPQAPITRADWDDEHDSPQILSDVINCAGSIIAQRIVSLLANPFHDEGSTTVMTGFFSHDDFSEVHTWELDLLVSCNDTTYSVVYQEGALQC
jgi:hypothetical protein